MRGTAGNAAAPTARCKNVRRGNFMMLPPQSALRRGHAIQPDALRHRLHPSCEEVEGANASSWHFSDMPKYFGDVRCWVNSGKHLLSLSFSGLDPNRT